MTDKNNGSWLFSTLAAAAVLTVTMGARQSLGLFIFPLNNSTGLGLVTISFALAVGQFVWGAVQPLAGAAADRFGPARVLVGGVLILALGSALTPFMTSASGLVISLGLLSAIGAGAGSFSVLIGAVAGRVPASQRGSAAGIINAGGSFGQFVFAPLLQLLISTLGWMGAMWSLAIITLGALPLVRMMHRSSPVAVWSTHERLVGTLRRAVKNALADRNYLLLHAGFFTCGFHIALIVTHLPGEVKPPRIDSVGGELVACRHRIVEHCRQSCRRLVRQSLSRQVRVVLHIRFARHACAFVSRRAEERVDVLSLRHRIGLYVASYGAANGGGDRQTVRHSLSRDAVWVDAAVASDRRIPGCMAGRTRVLALRRLSVDVVRRCCAGRWSGSLQPADSRAAGRTDRRARLDRKIGTARITGGL
jgi:Major Facilitator Superfamily